MCYVQAYSLRYCEFETKQKNRSRTYMIIRLELPLQSKNVLKNFKIHHKSTYRNSMIFVIIHHSCIGKSLPRNMFHTSRSLQTSTQTHGCK